MAARVGNGITNYSYSDGKWSARVGVYEEVPGPSSKTFRGRPVLNSSIGGGAGLTYYYRMRAQDSGASPPGYVSWTVLTAPDFVGAGYSGGTPTPIGPFVPGSIVIAETWREQE